MIIKNIQKKQKGKAFNKISNILKFKHLKFNTLRLVTASHGRITAKQIASISAVINKNVKKFGICKFNIYANHPITKKPIEIRMGKGKGNIHHYAFNAKIGITICTVQSLYVLKAYRALKLAQIRMPIKTKILSF